MKRKVLPCFMALSMTLTAVPNVAMAEDGSMNEAETVVETTVWTIVNKVDTIYKEKCRVQLLSAVPSTILLF